MVETMEADRIQTGKGVDREKPEEAQGMNILRISNDYQSPRSDERGTLEQHCYAVVVISLLSHTHGLIVMILRYR